VYSAKINGKPTTFGTSGLLYRSNKLMYDRTTQSLWSSLLGEPVIGPLADSGIKLAFFPVVLTTWEEWLLDHPDTTVVSNNTGVYPASFYTPESNPNSIYYGYRTDPNTMFGVWERDTSLATKAEVLGLTRGNSHKAYPIALLKRERIVNDSLGGVPIVIIASDQSSEAKAYARESNIFDPDLKDKGGSGVPDLLSDSNGVAWVVTEDHLVNTNNELEKLARLPAFVSFWFGWFAFHPDSELYEGAE
jgi:hypothetical protein